MLQTLLEKFKTNISEHQSLTELTHICDCIKNLLDNSLMVFNYSLQYPEKCIPIKNSHSYKTHNYFISTTNTTYYKEVFFIINCDVLFNELTPNSTDISIFIDGNNINLCDKNPIKNLSYLYRITACSFNVKAKRTKCKLQLMKNQGLINAEKINNSFVSYFDDNKTYNIDKIDILQGTYEYKDKIIFNKPHFEYYKPGEIPTNSYYFFIKAEECELFEFFKHIEHVPAIEYTQILENNINLNVWN
jgi:hypothetical protein